MKLKHYNIIAISLAILLVVIVYCYQNSNPVSNSNFDPTRDNISKVLQLDSQIYTNDTKARIREMKNIDLSACPSDFKVAFNAHIATWQELSDDGYGWGIIGAALTGGFGFADGGMFTAMGMAIDEAEVEELRTKIYNTYMRCLVIADKYNVNTSIYRK